VAGALAGTGGGAVTESRGNEKRTRFKSLQFDGEMVEDFGLSLVGWTPEASSSQATYDADESQES
jgi:hypothetical protein